MDLTVIEEKIKAKSATVPEFVEYIQITDECGDIYKFLQASCCFIDYCIANKSYNELKTFKETYESKYYMIKLKETTTAKLTSPDDDCDCLMEALANDFESYWEKMNIVLMVADCNSREDTQTQNEDNNDDIYKEKLSDKIDSFLERMDLNFTLFGKILFFIYLIFCVILVFVEWKFTPLSILAGIRLFTKTDRVINKISVWGIALLSPFIIASVLPEVFNSSLYLLLFLTPIVSIVLGMIKGFSVNKILFWNLIGINTTLLFLSLPIFIISISITAFLFMQIFFTEKWEDDLVMFSFCANISAAAADDANIQHLYHRQMLIYNKALTMPQKGKDSLIYVPSGFYTEPKQQSVGSNKPIIGTLLLLAAAIVGIVVVFNSFSFGNNLNNSKPSTSSINNTVQQTENKPQQSVSVNDQEDYPFTAQRVISLSELSSYSKEQLSIMRNEIYARHGYTFKRNDLREYFSKKTWYKPKYSNVDKYLSKIEKQNVQTILKAEKNK